MEAEKNLQAAIPGALLSRAREIAQQEHIAFDELIASAVEQRVRQHDFQETTTDERPIWEVIGDIMKDVPDEVFDRLPRDGASEHDHYIYGTPKRNA